MKTLTYKVSHSIDNRKVDIIKVTKSVDGKITATWERTNETRQYKNWQNWIHNFYNIAYYPSVKFQTTKN